MANPKHKGARRTRPTSIGARGQGPQSSQGENRLTLEEVFKVAVEAGIPYWSAREQESAAAIAVGVAYAEHGGQMPDANAVNENTNGTIDVGVWQINSVHKKATESLEAWTKRMQKPAANALETLRISGAEAASGSVGHWGAEGGGGAPWYAYGTATYQVGYAEGKKILAKFLNDPEMLDKLGIVEGESFAETAFGIAGWIAGAVGKASAKWFLGACVWVGKLAWDEVLHPVWGHTQRAVIYYRTEVMGKPKGFFITVTFWSTGYAILWRSVDDVMSRSERPEDTAVGRAVLGAKNMAVKRRLYTPQEAQAETKQKPKPIESAAIVKQTRTASVNRRRPVTVEFDKEPVDEIAQKRAEKEGATA